METLKDLMVENGDDKTRIFYLKVIIKDVFSDGWPLILVKGRVHKTKTGKSLVFCQTPLGPPLKL